MYVCRLQYIVFLKYLGVLFAVCLVNITCIFKSQILVLAVCVAYSGILIVPELYLRTVDSQPVLCVLSVLFAVAASVEAAFINYPTKLLCGVAKNKAADWMYQSSENSGRERISVNGTVINDHNGRYTVDGSSLIINRVTASDAGIYTCGHGRQLYHKLQLNVSGV